MSDIDQLRQLLLGEDKEVLDDLGSSLTKPENRSRFIGEVLPEAIRQSDQQGDRLVRSLIAPVTRCIRSSVEKNPQVFADALYPAMGPSIRKSISETLKQFVQSLNQVLEHSLSVKGMRWRWEAWRSGVSFPEIVLKNTLLYRVEEAYLIHSSSGLLIDHAAAPDHLAANDQDAVSAMLTAIQDFVRDTFSGGSGGDLETVEIGERTLWVIRGPHSLMACVVFGFPPSGLRGNLRGVHEEVQRVFGETIESFSGDRTEVMGVADILAQCLVSETKPADETKKSLPWPLIFMVSLLVFVIVIGWYFWPKNDLHQKRDAFLSEVAAEPGLVHLNNGGEQGNWKVSGLRDPLARLPSELAAYELVRNDVASFQFQPFQSLEAEIVARRALAVLRPPQGVSVSLRQGALEISGVAPPAWVDKARSLMPPAGVERIELAGLLDDQSTMLEHARRLLEPPEQVDLELNGRDLVFSGAATKDWLTNLGSKLAHVSWMNSCDVSAVTVVEWQNATVLANDVRETAFTFAEGVELSGASELELEVFTEKLNRLQIAAEDFRALMQVTVTGYSDGTGNQAWNAWLRHQRAHSIVKRLQEAGVATKRIHAEIDTEFEKIPKLDPTKRRAVVSVEFSGSPGVLVNGCR